MTLSLWRKVGVSCLFLVAVYVGVEFFDEGSSSFGVRRLGEAKGRQLQTSACDIRGTYQNQQGVNSFEITQTGFTLTVNFIGTEISFTGQADADGSCDGYIDFGSSGGQKDFVYDCETGNLVVDSDENGGTNTFTKPNHVANCPAPRDPAAPTPEPVPTTQGDAAPRSTYAYTYAATEYLCDMDNWGDVYGTAIEVDLIDNGGVDQCADYASEAGVNEIEFASEIGWIFSGPAPAFMIWDSGDIAECALCWTSTLTEYAGFPAQVYTTTPLPTPAPTPEIEPTPEPTPLPPGETEQPTHQPSPQPTVQPTPRPTPVPTPRPSPVPTSQPTPLPPGATYQPTQQPTYAPTSPPTPEVNMGAGYTMWDGFLCVEDWSTIWYAKTVVESEEQCGDRLKQSLEDNGLENGGMVVTNTDSDQILANGELFCVICVDHLNPSFVTDMPEGGWFHMWVYEATPTPEPTAGTPSPSPNTYPDHYAHQEAYPCNQDLSAANCEALVGLYATNPALNQMAFQTTNSLDIPTGCLYQPIGDLLVYNTNPTGGGYQYLPTGDLILMCAAGSEDGRHLYIRNKHGICLDAKERRDRAGVVHMWPCDQTGPAQDTNRNQHWVLDKSKGEIRSYDGICLDASERSENGGQVWMWPCNGGKNQQWEYDSRTLQIKSRYGYCLDARQRKTRGGLVHMWKCQEGNKNQEWILTNQVFRYDTQMDYSKNIFQFGNWMGDWNSGGTWYDENGQLQQGQSL